MKRRFEDILYDWILPLGLAAAIILVVLKVAHVIGGADW